MKQFLQKGSAKQCVNLNFEYFNHSAIWQYWAGTVKDKQSWDRTLYALN